MKRYLLLLVVLLLIGCHNGSHNLITISKISGINVLTVLSQSQMNDIVNHKIQYVRIPCRPDEKQFPMIDYFLSRHILPVIVFDTAKSETDYKNRIYKYVSRYKANVCYEVLNEPLALAGSAGYFHFKNVDDVITFMNKYIDYIHNMIGITSVLSCGIANAATTVERDLLEAVIKKGHQDIISIHIYVCSESGLLDLKRVLAKAKQPVWITEYRTNSDKDTFISVCGSRLFKTIPHRALFWFDYNSPVFGIINTQYWRK